MKALRITPGNGPTTSRLAQARAAPESSSCITGASGSRQKAASAIPLSPVMIPPFARKFEAARLSREGVAADESGFYSRASSERVVDGRT